MVRFRVRNRIKVMPTLKVRVEVKSRVRPEAKGYGFVSG